MVCNILSLERNIEQKEYYKTKYKNIIVVKLNDDCYSITHYQTAVAISLNRYSCKEKAFIDLDYVVHETREILKMNNIKSFKQYCKQNNIKQINF